MATATTPLKETLDIEQLLDWAYRVQCVDRRVARQRARRGPALYPSAAPFAAFELLGTRVDTSGVVMDDVANFKVDDALIIHDAVLRLGEMFIEWRDRDEVVVWDAGLAKASGKVIEQVNDQWRLVDGAGASGADLPWVALEQAGTAVLVIIHAKSGFRPEVHEDWIHHAGAAVPRDGSQRDRRGRIRRSAEGVSVHEVMHCRAIYTVWHAALALLVAELDGVLDKYAVTGPSAPAQPWVSARRKVLKQA